MKIMTLTQSTATGVVTAQTSAGGVSEWMDVGKGGCDSIAWVMTASAASSPTGATIQIQGSLDKTNVVLVGSTVSVSGNGSFMLEKDRPSLRYYRIVYVMASGTYTSTLKSLAKGDKD